MGHRYTISHLNTGRGGGGAECTRWERAVTPQQCPTRTWGRSREHPADGLSNGRGWGGGRQEPLCEQCGRLGVVTEPESGFGRGQLK